MPKYKYAALGLDGKEISGVERATSSGAARLALVGRDLQPLTVTERTSILKFELTKKRVSRDVIMQFARQLSVFIAAGIPILEAMEIILEETTDRTFKKALADMIDGLQQGDTFAVAAASHPEAFPPFFVGILASAELTGALDVVLNQLADYLQRDADAKSRITSA